MSNSRISLHEFVEQFEWQSETQKKGFQSLCKHLIDNQFKEESGMSEVDRLELAMMKLSCFFIQKDHESNQWYNERIGALDSKHTDIQAQLFENQRAMQAEIKGLKKLLKKPAKKK